MITKVKGSVITAQDNFNYINLLDVGGIADGSTDNTAVLNTALATGLPVYVPAGTFVTGSITVPANAVIFGSGPLSILKLKNTAGGSPLLTCGSGTVIKDVTLDGNKSNNTGTTSHTLAFSNAVVSQVINVTSSNAAGDGYNVSGASTNGVRFINCYATGFTKNGFTVENGTNIAHISCVAYSSDAVASPGDGFTLAPTLAGASLGLVTYTDCSSRNNVGRGFSALGFGSKNVSNASYKGCIASSNTGHGFYGLTTQQLYLTGCLAKSNGGDGFQLAGDTVYCRISESIADSNTGYGIRELVAGSTPNNNKFIYDVALNNTASNTITVVGGSSAAVN